ncbi:hypothetical protein [Wolbachia pipientis]|uniref:hypothetical protein n=1 Tax=Wolbachia pipientis TaxID=955 RepID=UPI0025A34AAD|nr:hypothetical protein [Wolbachia pipientis]MDM8335047.1 hypothetical protein [Wolbachia pipientis]
MNKKTGKPKGSKSSNQIAKTRRKLSKSDISNSVIPDYASVDSEVVPIKLDQELNK